MRLDYQILLKSPPSLTLSAGSTPAEFIVLIGRWRLLQSGCCQYIPGLPDWLFWPQIS